MGSHRSSVDQPGCESSEGVVEFRDSNSKRVTRENRKFWKCFLDKETASPQPARTEDGDRDVQGTAHHPCTKEAETFKSTTTPTRPSISIRPTCDCLLKLDCG